MFSIFFFENLAVYEMGKNIAEQGRPQMTTWCMRVPCWITKARNTRSEYVIITAFQLQLWLNERASLLHYT